MNRRNTERGSFHRDDGGQTLVVIALSIVLLLAAVALGVDWGYALTQRRVMQNAADASAIAAAKYLAANVLQTSTGPQFAVTGDAIYQRARCVADANRTSFRPASAGRTESITVQWSWNLTPSPPADPWSSPYGGTFTKPASLPACGQLVTSGTTVDSRARYIRVEAGVAYRALVGSATGTGSIDASAHAIAVLRGAPLPATGPTWPITRHYTHGMFNEACGSPCNPTNVTPVTFWSSNADDVVYGTFKGMVDYSRYSPLIASKAGANCYSSPTPSACVPQPIEHWDDRGPPASPLANAAAVGNPNVNCTPDNAKWVTWGDDLQSGKVAGNDTQCSLPNWAVSLFGSDPNNPNTGRLVLDKPRGTTVDSGANRVSVCSAAKKPPDPLQSPSCADPTVGDWVETQGGDTGNKLSDPLLAFIAAHGQPDDYVNVVCTQCAGSGTKYGLHVIVIVYLWDCAQQYDPATQTWTLVEPKNGPSNDCGDIHKNADLGGGTTVDRVHLFTIAPFRFYQGGVSSSKIVGFWGGLVSGDASCPTCVLNQFSNAVQLVADPG